MNDRGKFLCVVALGVAAYLAAAALLVANAP